MSMIIWKHSNIVKKEVQAGSYRILSKFGGKNLWQRV